MKTLYDKLQPKYKKELINNLEEWPSIYEALITELKNLNNWMDLTYYHLSTLRDYTSINNIDETHKLFSKPKSHVNIQ